MILIDALNKLTDTIQGVFTATKTRTTCGAQCGACCFEPVYATWAEAELIIETIRALPNGEAGVKMVAIAVGEWLTAFRESTLYDHEQPGAIDYRKLKLACPFLASDQNCDVYAVRPAGCRMHFTIGDPSWCGNLQKRSEQQYVDVVGTAMQIPPLLEALMDVGAACAAADKQGVTDHLGIMLAEVLGLEPKPSGARTFAEGTTT